MDDEGHKADLPPPGWVEAIERGEADVLAERTSPWSEVRARSLAELEEIEAARSRKKA